MIAHDSVVDQADVRLRAAGLLVLQRISDQETVQFFSATVERLDSVFTP